MKKIKFDNDLKRNMLLGTSKYLIDLSKLTFGGIILTGIIGLQIDATKLIWLGAVSVFFTALLGSMLYIISKLIKDE